eukprot:12470110-Prorocentrum_lima.AAC.1
MRLGARFFFLAVLLVAELRFPAAFTHVESESTFSISTMEICIKKLLLKSCNCFLAARGLCPDLAK